MMNPHIIYFILIVRKQKVFKFSSNIFFHNTTKFFLQWEFHLYTFLCILTNLCPFLNNTLVPTYDESLYYPFYSHCKKAESIHIFIQRFFFITQPNSSYNRNSSCTHFLCILTNLFLFFNNILVPTYHESLYYLFYSH